MIGKQNAGAGGDFVIDAVPIKAMANWDEFNTHLHNELQRYEINSSVSDRRSVYTRAFSPEQLSAYIECVKTTEGISVTPIKSANDSDEALILVTTSIPSSSLAGGGVRIFFLSTNATIDMSADKDGSIRMSNNESRTFVAHRRNNAPESMIVINGAGRSDYSFILWQMPKPLPQPQPVHYSHITCEAVPDPGQAAWAPLDISLASLITCRHHTEALYPTTGIYKFRIKCADDQNDVQGLGEPNGDGTWPQGCVIRPGQ
jgi:hypothetical protein